MRASLLAWTVAISLGTQAAAAAEVAPDSPVAIVEKLYVDFAWESVLATISTQRTGLFQLPRAGLEIYFTPALAALIERDQECSVHIHEICRLDYLPHWNSQDPSGATDLEIRSEGGVPPTVAVEFLYLGTGTKTQLKYRLQHTRAGWRIADIVDAKDGSSLVKLLEAPIDE
jgi:hypothetical protein